MLQFYGKRPPGLLNVMSLGGICPHCEKGCTFTPATYLSLQYARQNNLTQFVLSYTCPLCLGAIPIRWTIMGWGDPQSPYVHEPTEILPSRVKFDFAHVPNAVRKEIAEALACLSVGAYNGFAAMCRRAAQAIATNLGAEGTSKVEAQMGEALKIAGLAGEPDWEALVKAVLLTGHDGAHPHLPEVNAARAGLLLGLLGDLTLELYTRPGLIKDATTARVAAIEKKKQPGRQP